MLMRTRRVLTLFNDVPLRTRRVLTLFNDVPLRTRRVLTLFNDVPLRTRVLNCSTMFHWQKGVNTQWCSIENQKGVNIVQRCSIENQKLTLFNDVPLRTRRVYMWEPEGRYCPRYSDSALLAQKHLWTSLMSFWLSTDGVLKQSSHVHVHVVIEGCISFVHIYFRPF